MPKQDSKLTARHAVERVLRGKRRMTVGQITEAALPLTALKGKTDPAGVTLDLPTVKFFIDRWNPRRLIAVAPGLKEEAIRQQYRHNLAAHGFDQTDGVTVRLHGRNRDLYNLLIASRHPLAAKIFREAASAARRVASRQLVPQLAVEDTTAALRRSSAPLLEEERHAGVSARIAPPRQRRRRRARRWSKPNAEALAHPNVPNSKLSSQKLEAAPASRGARGSRRACSSS
jgi:hypothetical protein